MIEFAPATVSTNTEFNFARKKYWSVNLTQNTTFVFYNGEKDMEVQILITQGSTTIANMYSITWPSTVLGVGPNIPPSSTVLVTLQNDGTNWHFKSGSPSSLPSKFTSAAVGLMTIMTAANIGLTYHLTAGSGTGTSEIGRLPDVSRVYSGTGAGAFSGAIPARQDGSGSFLLSKYSGLAVGVGNPVTAKIDTRSNSGWILPTGEIRTRNTLSGRLIPTFSDGGDQLGEIVCWATGGKLGVCATNTAANCGCTAP